MHMPTLRPATARRSPLRCPASFETKSRLRRGNCSCRTASVVAERAAQRLERRTRPQARAARRPWDMIAKLGRLDHHDVAGQIIQYPLGGVADEQAFES